MAFSFTSDFDVDAFMESASKEVCPECGKALDECECGKDEKCPECGKNPCECEKGKDVKEQCSVKKEAVEPTVEESKSDKSDKSDKSKDDAAAKTDEKPVNESANVTQEGFINHADGTKFMNDFDMVVSHMRKRCAMIPSNEEKAKEVLTDEKFEDIYDRIDEDIEILEDSSEESAFKYTTIADRSIFETMRMMTKVGCFFLDAEKKMWGVLDSAIANDNINDVTLKKMVSAYDSTLKNIDDAVKKTRGTIDALSQVKLDTKLIMQDGKLVFAGEYAIDLTDAYNKYAEDKVVEEYEQTPISTDEVVIESAGVDSDPVMKNLKNALDLCGEYNDDVTSMSITKRKKDDILDGLKKLQDDIRSIIKDYEKIYKKYTDAKDDTVKESVSIDNLIDGMFNEQFKAAFKKTFMEMNGIVEEASDMKDLEIPEDKKEQFDKKSEVNDKAVEAVMDRVVKELPKHGWKSFPELGKMHFFKQIEFVDLAGTRYYPAHISSKTHDLYIYAVILPEYGNITFELASQEHDNRTSKNGFNFHTAWKFEIRYDDDKKQIKAKYTKESNYFSREAMDSIKQIIDWIEKWAPEVEVVREFNVENIEGEVTQESNKISTRGANTDIVELNRRFDELLRKIAKARSEDDMEYVDELCEELEKVKEDLKKTETKLNTANFGESAK